MRAEEMKTNHRTSNYRTLKFEQNRMALFVHVSTWLIVALLALTGCGKKEGETPGGGAPAANAATGKKLKLAFVSNNAANFWTIARAGCNDAVKELGDVEVDFRIPSTGSAAEQQQILDDLVARGI